MWLPSVGRLLSMPGFAVDVFVILSGFVITHLLETQPMSYLQFIGRRFFRLYPVFLLCLVLGLLTFSATYEVYREFSQKVGSSAQSLEIWKIHRENLLAYFAVSASMLHGAIPNAWLPHAQCPFDPPGWSISLEWQFYLVIPLIFFSVRLKPLLTLAIVIATVGFSYLYKVGEWGSFLPQHAAYFALGILSYYCFRTLTRMQTASGISLRLTWWTGILLLFLIPDLRNIVFCPWDVHAGDWLPLAIWLISFCLLVETHSPAPGRFARAFSKAFLNPLTQYLGRISYSTYLLHYFFIYAVMALCVLAGIKTNKYISLAMMLMIAAPLTVLSSHFSYQWIEKPGIELGRRFFRREKARVTLDLSPADSSAAQ